MKQRKRTVNADKQLARIATAIGEVSFFVAVLALTMLANTIFGCTKAKAETVEPKHKIAILDTGYDAALAGSPKPILCKTGHYDYIKNQEGIGSTSVKHGTIVANILAKELDGQDYCLIILTVLDERNSLNVTRIVDATDRAVDFGATHMNLSYAGSGYRQDERDAYTRAGASGVRLFIAAGNSDTTNHRQNLSWSCIVYPACYDIPNATVVGALKDNRRADYSNYGSTKRIQVWFDGSYQKDSGTSFAVPRALAATIRFMPTITKMQSGN